MHIEILQKRALVIKMILNMFGNYDNSKFIVNESKSKLDL